KLTRAPAHRISNDSVNTDRGKGGGECGKRAEQVKSESALRHRRFEDGRESRGSGDGRLGIRGADGAANRGNKRGWTRIRPDEQRHNGRDGERVQRRARFQVEAEIPDVADDADNRNS